MDHQFFNMLTDHGWAKPPRAVRSKMNAEFVAIDDMFERNLARELRGEKLIWRKPKQAGAEIFQTSRRLYEDLQSISKNEQDSFKIAVLACRAVFGDLFDTLGELEAVRSAKLFLCVYDRLRIQLTRIITSVVEHQPDTLAAISRHSVEMSIRHKDMFARENCSVSEAAVNVWATLVSERIAQFIMEELKRNLV